MLYREKFIYDFYETSEPSPRSSFYVVIGPGFDSNRRYRIKGHHLNTNIILLHNPNLTEYLMQMDVIVTLGGLTSL